MGQAAPSAIITADPLQEESTLGLGRYAALAAGPLLATGIWLGAPMAGLSPQAWAVVGLAAWMITWWITEAMPLPVTSLLPIVFLPLMAGFSFRAATAEFANSIIFLFLGGFILSAAMQKWNLHRRIALKVLLLIGCGAKSVVLGMMLVTAFLALWISNTATMILMLPMAVSIVALLMGGGRERSGFARALILGIAYAAALGGIGTFVGTPTNAILLGFLESTYGTTLALSDWMMFGVPLVILLIGMAWCILTFFFLRDAPECPGGRQAVLAEYEALGPVCNGERVVLVVFALTVSLWLGSTALEQWLGIRIEDAAVAIVAALLLFLIPVNAKEQTFTLTWKDAERIPWGVLVFFGGSLSLSAALTSSGVTAWLSEELTLLQGVPLWLVTVSIVLLIIVVSELMSNVATITAFLPILSALAVSLNVHPLALMLPATLAASCGFMMPGASAANALAFSTGHFKVRDLLITGFWMDVAAAIAIMIACSTIAALALGFDPSAMPEWATVSPQPVTTP